MPALGLQALKRRIRSVENTAQITRAMKLVAGAKLRRAQERAERSRRYFITIRETMARAAQSAGALTKSPLFEERPLTREAFVVVSSDRGLAGPFNANVMRLTADLMRRSEGAASVFAVGRKARDAYRRRGVPVLGEFINLGDDPHYFQAKAIADTIIAHYLGGEVDRVTLVYTEFVNAMVQRPKAVTLIPMSSENLKIEAAQAGDDAQYLFEPDPETVLADLVPRYVEVLLYGALLESKASEHGARMTAMDAATKNSEELLRTMTLTRNRLRQAAITREIAELVGGAAALE
ncbi:MAG: ATP synthase F1 subunit gamma [Clostridia bacterium]